MDSKQIEESLARYWNCETSVEEEQALREYFANAEFEGNMKEVAAMFRYFDQQRQLEPADGGPDASARRMANPKKQKLTQLLHNSLRIAAGIVVLMVAIWLVRSEIRQDTPQELVDTYSDPALAFEETKKALLMISKGFGTAEEQAKKINLFNEAKQQIQNPEFVQQD